MKKLTFVTQNANKLRDAKMLLQNFEIHHVNFDCPEIQSMDPKEIIEAKLRYAYERVKEPCFVMDAGLYLDCVDGLPGPFVKFWLEKKSGIQKATKIARLVKQPGCKFRNALGFFDGKKIKYFEEVVEGKLPPGPRGKNGYHWDAIFIPKGEKRTFAEMTFEEKQKYAPQKKLFKRLSKFLQESYV